MNSLEKVVGACCLGVQIWGAIGIGALTGATYYKVQSQISSGVMAQEYEARSQELVKICYFTPAPYLAIAVFDAFDL